MPTFREFFGSTFTFMGNLLLGVEHDSEERDRLLALERVGKYYSGEQPKQLIVKTGKEDDNVILNFTKKIVEKSANMLAGGEITFDFEDDEQAEQYIKEVYERNKKNKLLLNAAKMAGKYGTGYIRILPNYFEDTIPRLERLHPIQMKIDTYEEDIETVIGYTQVYTFVRNNKEVARKQTTFLEEFLTTDDTLANGWIIRDYEISENTAGKWQEISAVAWPYDFPPIIHWQANPTDESVYGESDIIDVLGLQDKINYNASKIGRIIRYHAHPKLWGRGFSAKSTKNWGEDEVIVIPGETGQMGSIEMQSDLLSSMNYLSSLIQYIFDITSTTNLSTIKDKLGQLTNFGLQVLYQDSLEKLYAKRLTFGEMLTELNRRLLILSNEGYEGPGGTVVWPADVIPQDQSEEAELIERDVNNEFVSKETARGLRGYNNEQELERIEGEKTDIGTVILGALERGQ